jgi:hypothetical protein
MPKLLKLRRLLSSSSLRLCKMPRAASVRGPGALRQSWSRIPSLTAQDDPADAIELLKQAGVMLALWSDESSWSALRATNAPAQFAAQSIHADSALRY